MLNSRFVVLLGVIMTAAALRLVPHPPNLTPIGAMALLGGACFSDRRAAFLVPLVGMFLSDIVLGLHPGIPVVYGCFALTVCLGLCLRRRRTWLHISGATLASSFLFYFVTNLAVWAFGSLYPKTLAGLVTCYVAALPFFRNTLLGDALYVAVLFGGFALVEKWICAVRDPALSAESRNG